MSTTKHTQEEWMKAYNALMDEECPGEANYDYFADPTEENIEKRDARLAAYTKWITKRNSDVKALIDELKESPVEVRFNLAVNVALKSIDKNMCRIISDVAALKLSMI